MANLNLNPSFIGNSSAHWTLSGFALAATSPHSNDHYLKASGASGSNQTAITDTIAFSSSAGTVTVYLWINCPVDLNTLGDGTNFGIYLTDSSGSIQDTIYESSSSTSGWQLVTYDASGFIGTNCKILLQYHGDGSTSIGAMSVQDVFIDNFVVAGNLEAHFTMDGTTGQTTILDSANSRMAELWNSPTFAAGAISNALNLIASSHQDATLTPLSVPVTNWSWAGWVYEASRVTNSNGALAHGIFCCNNGQFLEVSSSNGVVLTVISGSWVNTGVTIPLATKTHLAITRDGTNQKIYINAVLIDTRAYTATGNSIFPMTIGSITGNPGAGSHSTSASWDGWFDDIWIYSKALNSTEISALYALGISNVPAFLAL